MRFALPMVLRFRHMVWSTPVVLMIVSAASLCLALVMGPFHVFDDSGAIIVISLLPGMVSRPRTRTIVVLVRGGAFDTTAPWLVMLNAVFAVVRSSCNVTPRTVRVLMAGVLFTIRRSRPMTTSIFITVCFTPVRSLMFCQITTCRK